MLTTLHAYSLEVLPCSDLCCVKSLCLREDALLCQSVYTVSDGAGMLSWCTTGSGSAQRGRHCKRPLTPAKSMSQAPSGSSSTRSAPALPLPLPCPALPRPALPCPAPPCPAPSCPVLSQCDLNRERHLKRSPPVLAGQHHCGRQEVSSQLVQREDCVL